MFVEITGRKKTCYSIWKKMQTKKVGMDNLSDIMAFRIIVKKKGDCYKLLSLLHQNYTAIMGRFKDYISAPKPGIFLENISYVLVVATLSEITLFAVTEGSCKILRTAYNTPCEGIVYKAVGSQCGRIFLAGSDGSISEFMYSTESRLSLWNINVALQSGRDACYLNKHGHWDSRMVRLAPSFLRLSNTPSHCADALADLAVDNMRHVLYCLSTGGQLCVCSLAGGHDHSVRRVQWLPWIWSWRGHVYVPRLP